MPIIRGIKIDKEYYTLNELARSGLLPWRNIATVRKYVETYRDIFNPRTRGGANSKRYVIARTDIDRFNQLFRAGKLKGVRSLGEGVEKLQKKFLSLVFVGTLSKRAKSLRERLEHEGYRVDFHRISTRREFMSVVSGMEESHPTLLFLLNAEEGKLVFPEGETVSSTQIRQAHSNAGVRGSSVIMYTDKALSRFDKAFTEKGDVSFYKEMSGFLQGSKGTTPVVETLRNLPEKWRMRSKLRRVIRRPSPLKRAK